MERLFKGDRLSGYLVHVRPALESWKHCFVYLLRYLLALANENHPAAWPTKCFVCSSSHDVKAVVKRILRGFARNEPRDMRDIHYRDGADLVRDRDELCIIQFARIRRED